MKQLPFDSQVSPAFQVVEQRQGKTSLYPHTAQLPKIWKILQREFRDGLPDRIARVDHRADGYHKLLLYTAANSFCGLYHEHRQDQILLFHLPDQNLVTRIAIAQHITEQQEEGLAHRFRFYLGEDSFADVYLNGKRILFASHALERFSSRVTNQGRHDLISVLDAFFKSPAVLMLCDGEPAFVFPYRGSLIACPVRGDKTDYFLPTCLTVNEINKLEPILPPPAFNPHYDRAYSEPRFRNWPILALVANYLEILQKKTPR